MLPRYVAESTRPAFGQCPDAVFILEHALAGLEGPLVAELREELGAAADAGDWAAVERLAQEADVRPRQWLARNFLGLAGE